MVIIILVAARRGRPILGFAQRGTHGPALASAPAMPAANGTHVLQPRRPWSTCGFLRAPLGGGVWAHLQPIQALTYGGPSCPGPKEALPSASFPSTPPRPPNAHPWGGAAPVGDPSLRLLRFLVFQGALAGGGWEKKPRREGEWGKQNRELEGEGCGWASIQLASHFPPPASPLPVLAGALEAGAWPRRTQCLLRVKGGGRVKPQHPHPQLRPVVGVGPRLC